MAKSPSNSCANLHFRQSCLVDASDNFELGNSNTRIKCKYSNCLGKVSGALVKSLLTHAQQSPVKNRQSNKCTSRSSGHFRTFYCQHVELCPSDSVILESLKRQSSREGPLAANLSTAAVLSPTGKIGGSENRFAKFSRKFARNLLQRRTSKLVSWPPGSKSPSRFFSAMKTHKNVREEEGGKSAFFTPFSRDSWHL